MDPCNKHVVITLQTYRRRYMKVCPTTYSDLEYAQSRKCTMNGVTEGNNFSATSTSDVLVPERCPNTLDLRGH